MQEEMKISTFVTITLLDPKIISIFHQFRARPACANMQTDQALNYWLTYL
jgi:hypothetical protein